MQSVLKKIVCLVALVFVGACHYSSQKSNPPNMSAFIPEGAIQKQEFSNPQHNWWQTHYNISLPYPDVALTKKEYERIEQQGWLKCVSALFDDDWQRVVTAQSLGGEVRYQRVMFWARKPEIATVLFEYRTPLSAESSEKQSPINDQQEVMIRIDRFPNEVWDSALNMRCRKQ